MSETKTDLLSKILSRTQRLFESQEIPSEMTPAWMAEAILRMSEDREWQSLAKSWYEEQGISATSPKLPSHSPLLKAEIAERLQFDGDIPEWRTGLLPEGSSPALSVLSNGLAWQIGLQVVQAQEERKAELNEVVQSSERRIQSLLPEEIQRLLSEVSESPSALAVGLAHRESVRTEIARVEKEMLSLSTEASRTALALSGAATLPAPVRGKEISLFCQEEEKRKGQWVAISTTQGRRSVAYTLNERVAFRHNPTTQTGFVVNRDPEAFYVWETTIPQRDFLSARFSVLDNVVSVFLSKIEAAFGKEPLTLWVQVKQDLAYRKVGWEILVWRRRDDDIVDASFERRGGFLLHTPHRTALEAQRETERLENRITTGADRSSS